MLTPKVTVFVAMVVFGLLKSAVQSCVSPGRQGEEEKWRTLVGGRGARDRDKSCRRGSSNDDTYDNGNRRRSEDFNDDGGREGR